MSKDRNSKQSLSDTLSGITDAVKNLGSLYFQKARLKTTEKLTILLSTIAFAAVVMAIATVLLVFVSIGIGHLLAMSLAPHMAYLYVACFYLLLLIIAAVMRRRLFIDPIARFLSRLLVQPPEPESEDILEKEKQTVTPAEQELDYDRLAEKVVEMLEKKYAGDTPDSGRSNENAYDDETQEEGGEL